MNVSTNRGQRPRLSLVGSLCLVSSIWAALPARSQSRAEPIAEGYEVRFEVLADAKRGFPESRARISLVPASASTAGLDPLEGRLHLGPDDARGDGLRVAVARKSRGKPFTLLVLDRDGDGALDDERALVARTRRFRGNFRSQFETSLRLSYEEGPAGRDYPLRLWVETSSRDATPEALYYQQRGVAAAEIDLDGFVYEVVLADGDNDGVLAGDDWWTLRPALSDATQPRRVRDFARARGFAWKLELLDDAGAEGRLVRYEAGDERVRELRRDPRQADRLAPRAARPLAFTTQVEAAIAAAAERGVPYFLDFTADWCAPCRQMDELVYTAEAVVAAARDIVCIKVDAGAKKLKRRHRVSSYPTGILFRPDGTEIDRFRGYRSVVSMVTFFGQARP